ncbi:three component ABC system middle component [Mesorhizobium sp. M0674]|uniref:three component ABC system middle component n=1 Tax=unclassified Mesorhizobium TaxID=325217 RepID=UPI00333B9D18
MKHWSERPFEIRNLFNPAFCGLVLFRALSGFADEAGQGMPFSLSLLILPLCLQRQSREILQSGNRSYFLKVVAEHPELQVGFGRRCTDVLPFTFEALGLLMHFEAMAVQSDGSLLPKPKGVRKTISGTPESIACQRVATLLGKEFARVGDRGTIYTTLGIRP